MRNYNFKFTFSSFRSRGKILVFSSLDTMTTNY